MAEGRDLVKEALQDAKSLREAAVESAKNQIVEDLAPAVRQLLNKSFKGSLTEQSRAPKTKSPEGGTQQQKKDYDPDGSITPELHEGEANLTLEDALQEFFPAEKAVSEEKKMADEVKKDEKVEETAVSEEIEISESELRKVYEAALQTEVQVKKGFNSMTKSGELDDVVGETGILDKGGEKHFDQQDPPAKKDFTVKEMLQKGLEENKRLRENLRKAATMIETLGKKLHEVNLFNAKVLHVNKLLNSGAKLTKEQKTFVMESIDKANSIKEVKMVFETIVGSFKTSAALTESKTVRPPKADAQKARTSGTPDSKVLSESVDRASDEQRYSRIRELAGLVNGKR